MTRVARCRSCGCEGFRLTTGLCDGCHRTALELRTELLATLGDPEAVALRRIGVAIRVPRWRRAVQRRVAFAAYARWLWREVERSLDVLPPR